MITIEITDRDAQELVSIHDRLRAIRCDTAQAVVNNPAVVALIDELRSARDGGMA